MGPPLESARRLPLRWPRPGAYAIWWCSSPAFLHGNGPNDRVDDTQQYASKVFWFKMYVLFAAVIFTFTVRRAVTTADEVRVGPVWGKLVALVSITLWMTVAAGGRLIMYL